jgi:acyl transferase domain-containing protein
MISRSKNFYRTIRRRLLNKSLVSTLRIKAEQKPQILFVFPGMHGFWPGMGRGLFRSEPVFRETVLRCNQLIDKQYSPLHYFEGGDLNPISSFYVQIVIQVALAELWRSRGVEPQGTVGCSLGIITSCYVNESLSLEDILRVAHLYTQTPQSTDCKYNLIFIQVGLDKLKSILEMCPVEVSLLAELGPSENIAVCAEQDVHLVCSLLEKHGLTHSVTETGNGGHSPETAARFQSSEWAKIISAPSKYEFYSSLGGTNYPTGVAFDGNFWYWQIAKPCLSGTALNQALAAGYNTIVIVGSLALNHHIREMAAALDKPIVILDSIRNDEPEDWTFKCSL